MNKLGKGILYFSILVVSGIFLTGCSLTSQDPQNSTSKECFGKDKSIKGITQLEAILTNEGDNTINEKTEYSLSELEGLQFGMTGEKINEEYYGTYELCDLQTGEYLSKGEYVYENWTMFEKKTSGAVSESSGNTTSFVYSVDDVEELYVPGPGRYAVYTFSSQGEGSDWLLSDSLEFTVTE